MLSFILQLEKTMQKEANRITEAAHLIRALYRDYPVYVAKLPVSMVGHGRVRERVVGRYNPPAARA